MTSFFLGGAEGDRDDAQAAYDELCERSAVAVGCPARSRRIFKLDCRLDGRDCEIEVGKPLPRRGGVVVAILDHGREQVFAVYTDDRDGDAVRIGRHVYAVTEFS